MMDKSIANASEISYAQRKVRIAERNVNLAELALVMAKRRLRSAKFKPEAIMRMNRLGIHPAFIDSFRENGHVVMYSADLNTFLPPMDEEMAIIRKLEDDFDAMVYFIIAQTAYFGPGAILPMASFLYVNSDVVQLEHDNPIYGPNFVRAYTHNYDSPMDSECGDIYVQRTPSGGLRRIGMHEFEQLCEQARIIQQDD